MALANKYRPKSFSEVIGQDNAVIALRNIIKNKNFHNGYIFSGTRGVGKGPTNTFVLPFTTPSSGSSEVKQETIKKVDQHGIAFRCTLSKKVINDYYGILG